MNNTFFCSTIKALSILENLHTTGHIYNHYNNTDYIGFKKFFDIFYFSVLILLSINSIIYVISGSISIDCFFLLFVGHIFLLLCIIGNFSLNEKIPNFSWFDVGSFDILLNIVGIYLKSSYLEPVRSFWNLLFNFFKAGPEKPLVQNKFGPTIKEIPW